MAHLPTAPRVLRGGFVLLDATSGQPVRTIPFQYNPDSLTRTLTPQAIGQEPGDRLEALRLKGPPHETYKFDAEFDATDLLDKPEQNPTEAQHGLLPVLSAMESSFTPDVGQLLAEDRMASLGMIEVAPVTAPLTVLVLGHNRTMPVQLTELSVTEEAFDTSLQPLRAKVSISARVLTVNDLGFGGKGGLLFLAYHRGKAQLAALITRTPADLGLTSL